MRMIFGRIEETKTNSVRTNGTETARKLAGYLRSHSIPNVYRRGATVFSVGSESRFKVHTSDFFYGVAFSR